MDKSEFEKAQKKQIEAMNDTARNNMQCCMPKRSLCDTCRKVLVCPMMQISMREKCELYEKLPNLFDKIVNGDTTRSLNPIKEGNNMEAWEQVEKTRAEAEANAWKERLKEEYAQTKERYEKLKAYNNKKEVESNLMGNVVMEDYYNSRLMKEQQHVMGEYLHILELRAELAHIEL